MLSFTNFSTSIVVEKTVSGSLADCGERERETISSSKSPSLSKGAGLGYSYIYIVAITRVAKLKSIYM